MLDEGNSVLLQGKQKTSTWRRVGVTSGRKVAITTSSNNGASWEVPADARRVVFYSLHVLSFPFLACLLVVTLAMRKKAKCKLARSTLYYCTTSW